MSKKPTTSSENVKAAAEDATDATSAAGVTEPRAADDDAEKSAGGKEPSDIEKLAIHVLALTNRVAELEIRAHAVEADLAALRKQFGWPKPSDMTKV